MRGVFYLKPRAKEYFSITFVQARSFPEVNALSFGLVSPGQVRRGGSHVHVQLLGYCWFAAPFIASTSEP